MSMAKMSATMRFCAIMLGASTLLSVVQLGLGCDPTVVLLSLATIAVALTPVAVYGAAHFVGVLFIFLSIYFGFAALVVKTLLGQQLGDYLYVPVKSHLIAAVGILGAAVGALTARPLLGRRKAWMPSPADPLSLRAIAVASFATAATGLVLSRIPGPAATLSNFMTSYFCLAFGAELARSLVLTDGRRAFSLPAAGLAVGLVVWTLASNSKGGFLLLGVTYIAAMLAFRGRFHWGGLVAAVVSGLFLSSYVFPAVTYIARGDRDKVSPIQMVQRTAEATFDLMMGDEGARKSIEDTNTRWSRVENGRYNVMYSRHVPAIAERVTLIQYIDAVVWRVPLGGPYHGLGFILEKIPNNLPKFVNSGKEEIYTGHEIVWALQLYQNGAKSYPTVTLPTETFYAGGLMAVFGFSAIIYFLHSALLGGAFGNITSNIFGVYMVARYDHFIMSGVTSTSAFLLFRQLPFDILFFIAFLWFARRQANLARARGWAATAAAARGTAPVRQPYPES